jgi:hypothetical protein
MTFAYVKLKAQPRLWGLSWDRIGTAQAVSTVTTR